MGDDDLPFTFIRYGWVSSMSRSGSMKSAYMDELKGLLKDIDALRATMEPWYALRLEDEHVVDKKLDDYNQHISSADSLMTKINASMKLVKNAIVSIMTFRRFQYLIQHLFLWVWFPPTKVWVFIGKPLPHLGTSQGKGQRIGQSSGSS